jgi:hypothetical protein
MHEGIVLPDTSERKIDSAHELLRGRRPVPQITRRLESAFPIRDNHLAGNIVQLACGPEVARTAEAFFRGLSQRDLADHNIEWEEYSATGSLFGTVTLAERVQPFAIRLISVNARPAIKCVSPVGIVGPEDSQESLLEFSARRSIRIGAVLAKEELSYDLTVEDEVLLTSEDSANLLRINQLITRIVNWADQIEEIYLKTDSKLEPFRKQLSEEQSHGR